MAYANYVWLLNNPQFEDIPPGYVIHHLDFDEQNNDVSNLALMKKSHHTAYHVKVSNAQNSDEMVKLRNPIGFGTNLTIPRIYPYRNGWWKLRWQETDPSGKRIDRQLTNMNGKHFLTKEEAERGKVLFMKLHPHFNQNKERIVDLICQINEDIDPSELEDAHQMIKKIFPIL